MKKLSSTAWILLLCAGIIFPLFCGLFVIQPMGAIPSGATLIYWRPDLNLPFISSADGLLKKSGPGVSLLRRGLVLAKISKPILVERFLNLTTPRHCTYGRQAVRSMRNENRTLETKQYR